MSAKTKAALSAQVAADFPDNTSGDITPSDLRTFFTDLLDSILNTTDNAASQGEAEGGTNNTNYTTSLRVKQAIDKFAQPLASLVGVNAQTGTSYTLVLGDAGKLVTMDNASANTLTVPPNSSVAFPVNTILEVSQLGAGITTLAEGSGVTLRSLDGHLELAGRYAGCSLTKLATNEWLVVGALN